MCMYDILYIMDNEYRYIYNPSSVPKLLKMVKCAGITATRHYMRTLLYKRIVI